MREIETNYLNRREVAKYLGVHVNTIDKWNIPYIKISSRKLFDIQEVKAYLEAKNENKMKVKIKRIYGGMMPERKTEGSACFDCYARIEDEVLILAPHGCERIPLGFCVQLPCNFKAMVYPRSGLSCQNVLIQIGTIDSDYTGEVQAIVVNNTDKPLMVENGERIAQLSIERVNDIDFQEVEKLKNTLRGARGFGSTGMK